MFLSRRALIASLALTPFMPGAVEAAEGPLAPRPPGPDEALVYLYRKTGGGMNMLPVFVLFGEVKAVQLKRNEYTWLYLKAGRYDLKPDGPWSFGIDYKPKTVELTGGQTHYVQLVLFFVNARDRGAYLDLGPAETAERSIRGLDPANRKPLAYRPPEPVFSALGATID